jgi:anti-sigma regulatory factor (Ser/Thr protein kinase)
VPAREFRFPASSTAPALARASVGTVLEGLTDGQTEDVLLLLSELVTNAVRHTSSAALSDVIVRLDARPELVRVEVLNPGTSFDPPAPQTPSTTGTGLGLFLVDALAREWGVEREGQRTKVWFEIPAAAGEDRAEAREGRPDDDPSAGPTGSPAPS